MARKYIDWSSSNPSRLSSTKTLSERPHITNLADGKRYYSSVDAEIYFGDRHIDEVLNINWSIQQQAMPIYGYNSYCFDDMAIGSRIVQGQFSLNFIKAGFLTELQKNNELPRISRKLYGKDKRVDSKFSDDFRKRLNMPIWDGGFDIVVGFGDHGKTTSNIDNSLYKTYLVLDCCQITGSMVQLDHSGMPVSEIYSFIARDIKYRTATAIEQDPFDETEGSIEKDTLSLMGVFDLTTEQCTVRLSENKTTTLHSAQLSILNTFSDKTLNSMFTVSPNSNSDLINIWTKEKTKSLKYEIEKNKFTKIKVQADISYWEKNPGTENNTIKKVRSIIDFAIKSS